MHLPKRWKCCFVERSTFPLQFRFVEVMAISKHVDPNCAQNILIGSATYWCILLQNTLLHEYSPCVHRDSRRQVEAKTMAAMINNLTLYHGDAILPFVNSRCIAISNIVYCCFHEEDKVLIAQM